MAKIGLTNFRYGILTEAVDGTPTYTGVKTPGHAITCKVDITNSDAKLYGDDTLIESDTTFASGSVTMGIDNDDITTMADLLGHTKTTTGTGDSARTTMTRNANDTAPYVGFGRVITKMIDGVYKYKVEFLYKVKFSEPSQDNTTKGESVEFGTTEVPGVVSALANGKWSETAVFADKATAIAFLEGILSGSISA